MNNNVKIGKGTWALLAAVFVLLLITLFVAWTSPVHANPSSFLRSSTSATNNTLTSTSTQTAAVNGGTGTTTVVLNGGLGTNFAANSVALEIFRMASTGRQISKIDFQYSMNCDATVPDWYPAHASSTLAITGSVLWPFASTTPYAGGTANDFDQTLIQLGNVPTKCVRAVITTPAGISGSSTIWAELTGKKETY